jgi:hypothetical protein
MNIGYIKKTHNQIKGMWNGTCGDREKVWDINLYAGDGQARIAKPREMGIIREVDEQQ